MYGRVACSLVQCLLERVDGWLYLAFDDFVKRHYSRYAFKHVARIDVPTFMDPSVSQRLDAVSLRYGFCTVGRTLGFLICLCHLVVCALTQMELSNSSLEGLGLSIPQYGVASHLHIFCSICRHNPKRGLCQDGRSQATCQRSGTPPGNSCQWSWSLSFTWCVFNSHHAQRVYSPP